MDEILFVKYGTEMEHETKLQSKWGGGDHQVFWAHCNSRSPMEMRALKIWLCGLFVRPWQSKQVMERVSTFRIPSQWIARRLPLGHPSPSTVDEWGWMVDWHRVDEWLMSTEWMNEWIRERQEESTTEKERELLVCVSVCLSECCI